MAQDFPALFFIGTGKLFTFPVLLHKLHMNLIPAEGKLQYEPENRKYSESCPGGES